MPGRGFLNQSSAVAPKTRIGMGSVPTLAVNASNALITFSTLPKNAVFLPLHFGSAASIPFWLLMMTIRYPCW